MLALETATGKIKWASGLQNDDDWNASCIVDTAGTGNLPQRPGGAGLMISGRRPMHSPSPHQASTRSRRPPSRRPEERYLFSVRRRYRRDPVGAQRGAGLDLGGMEWGTATDGKRIYVAISNFDKKKYVAAPRDRGRRST